MEKTTQANIVQDTLVELRSSGQLRDNGRTTVALTSGKHFKIATLFFKPEAYKQEVKIDYVGIRIPNKFIVGYGLDYDGLGRNLPEIYQIQD